MIKFKTIDEIVSNYSYEISNNLFQTSVYMYILKNQPELVLAILTSDSNRPSEHDIFIVQTIDSIFRTIFDPHDSWWCQILNKILEVYSNRK